MDRPLDAVLVTGVYGSGKSSVGAEIADLLEKRGERYALLDLDFLSWGYPGGDDQASEHRMLLKNLAAVAGNYMAAGVRSFILAGFIRDRSELDSLRGALGMPLRVVRLTVSLAEIERRLGSDVTSGRQDDLRQAGEQIAASHGVGIEDLAVSNERPVREVAMDILDWLGWDSAS
jgi:gluconate kinase